MAFNRILASPSLTVVVVADNEITGTLSSSTTSTTAGVESISTFVAPETLVIFTDRSVEPKASALSVIVKVVVLLISPAGITIEVEARTKLDPVCELREFVGVDVTDRFKVVGTSTAFDRLAVRVSTCWADSATLADDIETDAFAGGIVSSSED